MKKSFAILLAMVCLLICATAFAATPSKTTVDMTAAFDNGQLHVDIVLDIESVTTQIANLQAYVAQGNPPAKFFGDNVTEKIAELLPGVSVDSLNLHEFVTVQLDQYDAEMGDVSVTFTFATEYKVGQKIVAVIGIFDSAGNVTWHAAPATVEDGFVIVEFSKELLAELSNNPFAMAILSE